MIRSRWGGVPDIVGVGVVGLMKNYDIALLDFGKIGDNECLSIL